MTDQQTDIQDKLDEALDESFPASDPIAVTPEPHPWDNTEFHRFELDLYGQVAFLRYMRSPGVISLVHTQVPEELQGRGVGGDLAKFALETAREEGLRVKVVCPFVAEYLKKHPEYADLVDSTS